MLGYRPKDGCVDILVEAVRVWCRVVEVGRQVDRSVKHSFGWFGGAVRTE